MIAALEKHIKVNVRKALIFQKLQKLVCKQITMSRYDNASLINFHLCVKIDFEKYRVGFKSKKLKNQKLHIYSKAFANINFFYLFSKHIYLVPMSCVYCT